MGLIYLPERGIQGWFLPDDTLYWDQEHPLLKDAILAFAFVNGHWMNLLTGRRAAIGTTTAISSSSMGRVVRTLATNTSHVNTNITPTVTEAKIAYLGTISLNASAAGGGILSSKNTTGNGGGIVNASGPILRSSFEATDGADLASGDLPVTYGKLLPFCATVDDSTNDFYLGGVKATQGTGKTCSATTLSGSGTLSLGRRGTYYTETSSNLIIVRQEKITDRQYEAYVSAPFEMFHKRRIWVPVSSGGGRTGTLAATESGSDTASLSGDVLVKGALAATESGADSAAIAGGVLVEGALSTSESGADAAALAGDVLVKGALAAAESGNDTASFIGEGFVPTATGTLAASESGSDTASMAGKVYIAGMLSAVEGGLDGFAASGNILVKGALAVSETGEDTAAFVQETLTLTPADLKAIAAAVWADPRALTLQKFMALK